LNIGQPVISVVSNFLQFKFSIHPGSNICFTLFPHNTRSSSTRLLRHEAELAWLERGAAVCAAQLAASPLQPHHSKSAWELEDDINRDKTSSTSPASTADEELAGEAIGNLIILNV